VTTARAFMLLPASLLALAGALTLPAVEASGMLSVRLQPVIAQPRSHAPIWVDVELNSTAGHLIEGSLDIVFMDGNEVIGRYRSGALALTNGVQRFRLMLPAISTGVGSSVATAAVRFVTEKETWDLGTQSVFAPSTTRRSLVVCMSTPREESDSAYAAMARNLLLEQFDPDSGAGSTRSYSSSLAKVPPQDLPAHPLGYCSFDAVFLAGEGFSQLEGKQLDALLCWLEGGGSLCVLPRGGLRPCHVQFLNRIAGSHDLHFALSGGDVQISGALPQAGIGMFRCGMGRAVVISTQPESQVATDSPEWRKAVAFLWRIRHSQLSEFVGKGQWRTDQQEKLPEQRWSARPFYGTPPQGSVSFGFLPFEGAWLLRDSLMPQSVRLIPLWLLASVCVLFLLVVGPLDYYVLGILKRRRYTWAAFPAVSIAFALFLVYLSERYMGGRDQHGALVLTDLSTEGKVLRWSRYEMAFLPRGREERMQVKNALYAQVNDPMLLRSPYMAPAPYGSSETALPFYCGRIPADFQVLRSVPQWMPLVHRVFSFGPIASAVELNWDAVAPQDLQSHQGLRQLADKLLGGRPFDGCIFCLHESDVTRLYGDESILRGRSRFYAYSDFSNLLRQFSAYPRMGFFSVVSRISPTGSGNFEDLSLLDQTDSQQWLLMAVTRVGADYVVYRRMYYGVPP